MAVALKVISPIVISSTGFRPMRSPSGPKMKPPNGRTTNATASVPKVAIEVARTGTVSGVEGLREYRRHEAVDTEVV